jgi:hypothetical protein
MKQDPENLASVVLVGAAEPVMRTATAVESALVREPARQAVATTKVGQVVQAMPEILISMTPRTVEAVVGAAGGAEVMAVEIDQAGANTPPEDRIDTL